MYQNPSLIGIREILIYAKTIKYMHVKKSGRKPKDSPTVHVLRKLFDLILGKQIPIKYDNP